MYTRSDKVTNMLIVVDSWKNMCSNITYQQLNLSNISINSCIYILSEMHGNIR